MSELQERLRQEVASFHIEAARTFRAIDWRLDHKARSARQELHALKEAIQVDADNPPKTLQVEAGSGEYTSVRRVEGNKVYRAKDDSLVGVYGSETIFEVASQALSDRAIGVLVVPSGVECQNEELIEKYPPDTLANWNFEAAMADGVPYKDTDWKISTASVTLIVRRGNNVYILGSTGDIGERALDRFDSQEIVSLLKPDKKGMLRLGTVSRYLSQSELDVKRKWYDTRARFYVMVKGSSDVQTRRRPVAELKLAEVTQRRE